MKKVLYNGHMRTLHSGSRGGHYVISSGRKVYLKVKSSSKKTGPKKKTSSALKKKSGPKKKTSAAKRKPGPKKKTSAAKRKPGPKKKSKRGFRMPRLFKGGGDIYETLYDIFNLGITKVVQRYPSTALTDIDSLKDQMQRLWTAFDQMVKTGDKSGELFDEIEWETVLKPIAVQHFQDVIVLTDLCNTYSNDELDGAIADIATFSYWYHYINDSWMTQLEH